MAYYLVTAVPVEERIEELRNLLLRDAFVDMRPFGGAITFSLRNARLRGDGAALWEEEDYCTPPLAQERSSVLDSFFRDLATEPVRKGEGWKRIAALPPLFPDLAARRRTAREEARPEPGDVSAPTGPGRSDPR